ncbi:MAG: hypothetical protein HOW73_10110 [Polyangiaceae bacterium]|nr:hypothetical protein [Polyangiaceae bacterium]
MRIALGFLAVSIVLGACGDDGAGAAGGGGAATGGDSASGAGAPGGQGGNGGGTGGVEEEGGAGGGEVGGSNEGGAGGGIGGAGGGGPADGYGELSGTCGVLDAQDVASPDPDLIQGIIDFSARPAFDVSLLSSGGQEMYADGNLGGSSLYSEIFAYEVLYRCDAAVYLKSEAEIVYQTEGKKTDLLIELDGEKVGVSVVRAMSYPEGSPYPVSQAYDVLEGKLADIIQSSQNVAPEDAWQKQFLSVLAQTPDHAAAIVEAYAMVPAETKADTIVIITVTEGEDDFIYYNQ